MACGSTGSVTKNSEINDVWLGRRATESPADPGLCAIAAAREDCRLTPPSRPRGNHHYGIYIANGHASGLPVATELVEGQVRRLG